MSTLFKIYIFFIGCFLASCTKTTLDEPISNDPVFTINAKIDNEEIEMVAGDNGYFMFTSYEKMDNGSIALIGELKNKSVDCGEYCHDLKIILSENKLSIEETDFSGVEEFLTKNFEFLNFDYTTVVQGEQVYTFLSDQYNSDSGSAEWLFYNAQGDIAFTENSNGVVVTRQDDLPFQAKLTTTTFLGCTSSQESTILPTFQNQQTDPSCVCNYEYEIFNDSVLLMVPDTTNLAYFNWENPEYIDANSTQISGDFGACYAALTYTGCECETCNGFLFNPDGVLEACETTFSFAHSTVLDETFPFPYNVEIIYTNNSGKTFYSSLTAQESNHFFEILKVESYENNSSDQETKRLEIAMECLLKNEDGSIIQIEDFNAFFGVAYPY